MKFSPALIKVTLLKRYKRFLADVQSESGEIFTIHCPNTGSMKNCLVEGAAIWISKSDNPKRKYAHTWEIATTPCGYRAGVNTARANGLVEEAVLNGKVFGEPVNQVKREVPYGEERSRIDLHVQLASNDCFMEVKNLTLHEGDGKGFFPDSVSVRGTKHLRELSRIAQGGARAMLMFCVQHSGIERVAPARHIDKAYAAAFDEAIAAGVEVRAMKAKLGAEEIVLEQEIEVDPSLSV